MAPLYHAPVTKLGFGQSLSNPPNDGPQRRFPETTNEWEIYFPTVEAPISIWTCEDVADPLVDSVADVDLFSTGTVSFGNMVDPLGRSSVGFSGTVCNFSAVSPNDLNVGHMTGSITVFMRIMSPTPTLANRVFGGKRTSGGSAEGYSFLMTNTTGLLTVTTKSASFTNSLATSHQIANGEFQDVAMSINRATGMLYAYTASGPFSGALTTVAGHLDNSGLFSIGRVVGAGGPESGSMVSYAAFFNTQLTYEQYLTIISEV